MTEVTFPISKLSDVETFIQQLPRSNTSSEQAARSRQDMLTKPAGSLGRLEDLAVFMAGWQQQAIPKLQKAQALVFAGNHGICAQGVNPFPQAVTAQMVQNFKSGGAAINQLCKANGADLSVIDIDLERPTADFTQTAAMSAQDCIDALNIGAAAIALDSDIVILGEMGIGNSTVAAALAAAVFGGDVQDWVGRGTGSDDEGVKRKVDVIERGLSLHKATLSSGPEILSILGGREQAALCGAVLAARAARIPVILDGFICTAAVAPLYAMGPSVLDHCLIGHLSVEPGHQRLINKMNKTAILDFDMRLGEGSGAALALGILRSALACHAGMSTFDEAGVAEA